ncbi:uncharacterized protein [Battus philenor]|uniref:uncharacterized protein n=1 Tax=Battus philenor TaxID=42288 RepID=UPI0035CFD32B
MIAKTLCFSLLVGLTFAAVWQGRPPQKPKEFANKEGCYVKEVNDVIPYGTDIKPIGYCYSISCSQHMMHYASCGAVHTDDPKCYITEIDLRVPYPECCPDIKCDLDNTLI